MMNESLNHNNSEELTAKEELENIDISTEEGKFEWLDTLLGNAEVSKEEELKKAIDEDEEETIKGELEIINISQKLLTEVDLGGNGGLVGSLERTLVASRQNEDRLQKNGATKETLDAAFKRSLATSNLIHLVKSEMSNRNMAQSSESSPLDTGEATS